MIIPGFGMLVLFQLGLGISRQGGRRDCQQGSRQRDGRTVSKEGNKKAEKRNKKRQTDGRLLLNNYLTIKRQGTDSSL